MIKWCAYCQEFMEELAPFDDLTVSHGMCSPCFDRGLTLTDDEENKLQLLVRFQKNLYAAGQSGDTVAITELLQEAQRLKVKPLDIILGFLNPMLVHIGYLWNQGKMTVREEHIFTQFSERLLEAIRSRQSIKNDKPLVLLASANSNYHSYGLKLIHIWLSAEEISSELIVPGLPLNEFIDYTKLIKPRYVGISVSDYSQLAEIKTYIETINEFPKTEQPKIFIGGYPVKTGQITPKDLSSATVINDFRNFVMQIKHEQSVSTVRNNF